jgi:uncharacterized protein
MTRNAIMPTQDRPVAIVTGASTGIGYELALQCADHGYDLVVAADEPEIQRAAIDFRDRGVDVRAVETDLSNLEGVDQFYDAAGGRPVDALLQHRQRAEPGSANNQ